MTVSLHQDIRLQPGQLAPEEHPHPLADLSPPVLAGTARCLQLLAEQPVFNLRAASELIRKDAGAVLCTFDLAAEQADVDSVSDRLEDCVANIGVHNLLHALTQHVRNSAEERTWADVNRFAVRHAHLWQTMAASLGLSLESAYMVGLLQAACTPTQMSPLAACLRQIPAPNLTVLLSHRLPPGIREALEAIHRPDSKSVWVALMRAVEDLSAALVAEHTRGQVISTQSAVRK